MEKDFEDLMNHAPDRVNLSGNLDRFNHPIAKQTSWSPLKSGGTNFKAQKLKQPEPHIALIQGSIQMKIFAFIFFTIGAGFLIAGVFKFISPAMKEFPWLVVIIFGGAFGAAGVFLVREAFKELVIDKREGIIYKQYLPKNPNLPAVPEDTYKIKEVVAIQLIKERIKGDESTYYSYEMNLVMADASRLNLMDHGNPDSVVEDANTLSGFLDVPVWNGM
ncbi:MAG: hypothetical protein AAFY71_26925 [Bacteroidota bacterium]